MIQSAFEPIPIVILRSVIVPQFPDTYVISTNRVVAKRLGTSGAITAIMHSAEVRSSRAR
jgi:hypothetical protein